MNSRTISFILMIKKKKNIEFTRNKVPKPEYPHQPTRIHPAIADPQRSLHSPNHMHINMHTDSKAIRRHSISFAFAHMNRTCVIFTYRTETAPPHTPTIIITFPPFIRSPGASRPMYASALAPHHQMALSLSRFIWLRD